MRKVVIYKLESWSKVFGGVIHLSPKTVLLILFNLLTLGFKPTVPYQEPLWWRSF
jgi:hypothetical protein